MFLLKIGPRYVERNPRLLGVPLQIGEQRTILRLGPGLNRAFRQCLQLVRDDEIKIEIDRVAESLAPRARAVRIVKRKEPRLWLFIAHIALLALKTLREP